MFYYFAYSQNMTLSYNSVPFSSIQTVHIVLSSLFASVILIFNHRQNVSNIIFACYKICTQIEWYLDKWLDFYLVLHYIPVS